MLKTLGVKGKRELYDICNEIYVTCEWPVNFLDSVIIPIEKSMELKTVSISEPLV